MQFLIIAYENEDDFEQRKDAKGFRAYMDPWYDYSGALSNANILQGGQALEDPQTATCLSLKDGQRLVQDGPFIDTKEQIGGFFLIDVESVDVACEWAAKCPAAKTGFVEVRPVPTYS
ncbi:MAG: YciI family protein [Pseudomonadota bacterium]